MANINGSTGELREDVPLKKGIKSSKFCFFNEDCLGGSKFINIAFAVLSFLITLFLFLQIYYGDYQIVPNGSVASDGKECSEIGTTILKKGGNAVDATIATALCLTVVCPHTTSLDSNGQILIYNHRYQQSAEFIDFQNMANETPYLTKLIVTLIYIYKQYATLSWQDLVYPAMILAKKGFLVSKQLEHAIVKEKPQYFNTNIVAGQIINLPTLSETLENIYNMSVDDIYDSIPDENKPKISLTSNFTFKNYNILIPNIPGDILGDTLKLIEKLNLTVSTPDYLYKIANITKFQYERYNLSNILHVGTSSNIAVMDLNDLYVSFTSGMSKFFGSKDMTKQGYFLDVATNKTTSSRMPFIIADKFICGRRILSGANDIPTATQLISTLLIANQNVTKSIESPRFNILQNNVIGIEDEHIPRFTNDEIQSLEKLTKHIQPIEEPYFSCNVVEKFKDDLSSHSDSRGGGISSRF